MNIKSSANLVKSSIYKHTRNTQANIVNEIVNLPVATLKDMLRDRGQSAHGTKSDLVMKLTLRQLNEDNISAGKFQLHDMTVPELRELKTR